MDRTDIGILHPQSTSSFNHAILQLALYQFKSLYFLKEQMPTAIQAFLCMLAVVCALRIMVVRCGCTLSLVVR